jgi:hypothetical protein
MRMAKPHCRVLRCLIKRLRATVCQGTCSTTRPDATVSAIPIKRTNQSPARTTRSTPLTHKLSMVTL